LDNILQSFGKCVDDLISMEPKVDVLPCSLTVDAMNSDDQNSATLAEVSALQLPESLAQLRDSQKKIISRQAKRAQAIKSLTSFFDEIAGAAHTFASSLQIRLSQDGYGVRSSSKKLDLLAVSVKKFEGTHTQKCWNSVIDSLEEFVKSAFHLSSSLHADGQKRFGTFLQTAEKDIKLAYDAEETRWRRVCDSAKAKVRSSQRYEQSVADLAKAEERLHSMPEETEEKKDSDLSSGMSKALGNMFSILPGGGEEAMSKMLKPGQRLAIVRRNHEEALARVVKDNQTCELRKSLTAECVDSYTKTANDSCEKFLSEEKEVWSAAKASFVTIFKSFQLFEESRHEIIDSAAALIKNRGEDATPEDIRESMERIDEKRRSRIAQSEQEDGTGELGAKGKPRSTEDGFYLQVRLEKSKYIYGLLNLVSSEDTKSPLNDDDSDGGEVEEDAHREKEEESVHISLPLSFLSSNQLTSLDNTVEPDPIRARSRSVDAIKFTQSPSKEESKCIKETIMTKSDIDSDDVSTEEQKIETEGLNAPKSIKVETQLFLNHFWEETKGEGDDSNPPTIIASFSCAYWPKTSEGHISPLLHGRMFVTSSTMYFIGWTDKKIVLNWSDAISVTREKTMAGTVDNALQITYDSGEGESSYFFGSFAFRENAFRITTQMTEVAKSLNEITEKKSKKSKKLPEVPPDEVVKTMELVFSKKIKNMSIARFYEICWSEGNGTDAKPFYGPWLDKCGCFDIEISEWDDSEGESDKFTNAWCGEKYDRKRTVEFKAKRTSHLYIGPPIAGISQTHFCRVEGDEKCVLSMAVQTNGIPYADVFSVEARWVARRVGSRDLSIDCGIFVDFKKNTMLKSKIRQGTIAESTPVYLNLFDEMKDVCAANAEPLDETEEEEEDDDEDRSLPEEEMPEIKSRFQIAVGQARAIKSSLMKYCGEMKNTAAEHPAFQQIDSRQILMAIGSLFALLILCWFVSPDATVPQNDVTNVSREEMEQFTKRLDDMNSEMKEMRIVLKQILSLMQESHSVSHFGSAEVDDEL